MVNVTPVGYRYLNDEVLSTAVPRIEVRVDPSPSRHEFRLEQDGKSIIRAVNVGPYVCYACDAVLDKPGPGEVPLCLKCRAGDGERTPEAQGRCESTMLGERCTQAVGHEGNHTGTPVPWPRGSYPHRAGGYTFTVNGKPFIQPADWNVRGVNGEQLPCVPHDVDLCRLCPMPAVIAGYCQSCWCSRLTEMDRKAAAQADPYRPANPEKAAAHDAFFEQLGREFEEAAKKIRDQIDRDYERSFKVLGLRRDDRDELGDGSEDEEC